MSVRQDQNSVSPSLYKSWAEQVTESRSHNTSREDSSPSPDRNSSANNVSNSSNVSQERQIAVEFIDDVNEEKYKRLVQEEKIKTPFKRRHELSPLNSSNSSNSDGNSESNDYTAEKRLRHNSQTSSASSHGYVEKDPAVLARRQKQIDYGKNTLAYERYVETVPRMDRTRDHPSTPNKYGKYSRRAFDGLVKIWRKQLHHYDPPNEVKQEAASDSSSEDSD